MPTILDGNRIRDEIKNECRPRVARLIERGRPPGLAVVLVGHDPASEIYVRSKVKTSHELGIHGETITPPESITTQELLAIVEELNRRPEIDGILVQMPLPPQVDAKCVLLAVSPDRDVDGFHPCNVGNLVTGRPGPRSCTPAGIIELLKRYRIPIAGRRAVVVGRSDIVGKPMAIMLLHENATVTITIRKRRTYRRCAAKATFWWRRSGGRPAHGRLHPSRRHGHRRRHESSQHARRNRAHFSRRPSGRRRKTSCVR
jgi:methylenetetrahydrofolate dehydrogenase (NADP+)/methenyltetrahydrofolate cyclohydrolase